METTNVETIEEAGNEFPRSHPILTIEGGKSPRHPLMRHPVLDTLVGNVAQCLEEWKRIGAPEWILLGFQNGFLVELHSESCIIYLVQEKKQILFCRKTNGVLATRENDSDKLISKINQSIFRDSKEISIDCSIFSPRKDQRRESNH
jgi:hypothetical protein